MRRAPIPVSQWKRLQSPSDGANQVMPTDDEALAVVYSTRDVLGVVTQLSRS